MVRQRRMVQQRDKKQWSPKEDVRRSDDEEHPDPPHSFPLYPGEVTPQSATSA